MASPPVPRHLRIALLLPASLLAAACGAPAGPSVPTPPPPPPAVIPATLAITGGDRQAAAAGTLLLEPVSVTVRDATGRPVAGQVVTFTVTGGAGWTVPVQAVSGSDGRVTTEWYLGPVPGMAQQLRAALGSLRANATATAAPLVAGTTYRGHRDYIEFQAGDGPLVVSAPHGGSLAPAEIPDRSVGTTVTDVNTDPLARALADAFLAHTGTRPHLVVVRLRRTKLDANREILEAANGHPLAERAWREYHGFIEAAKVAASAAHARPFYVDLHGHGHAIQRLELGYLLAAADLDHSDATLSANPAYAQASSIRGLAGGPTPFAELLRGAASLGGRFAAEGFAAVPSPLMPSPGSEPYFNGGYSTARHGGREGGPVNGVQVEANFIGVRDTQANRLLFAAAAARVLAGFLGEWNQ